MWFVSSTESIWLLRSLSRASSCVEHHARPLRSASRLQLGVKADSEREQHQPRKVLCSVGVACLSSGRVQETATGGGMMDARRIDDDDYYRREESNTAPSYSALSTSTWPSSYASIGSSSIPFHRSLIHVTSNAQRQESASAGVYVQKRIPPTPPCPRLLHIYISRPREIPLIRDPSRHALDTLCTATRPHFRVAGERALSFPPFSCKSSTRSIRSSFPWRPPT